MGENPIALRSKKKLVDALAEIMEIKNYRDITITELCERANLSRPAFYQNFGHIDDVAARCLAEKSKEALQLCNLEDIENPEELAEIYLDIMLNDLEFIVTLSDNGLMDLVVSQYTKLFFTMDQTSQSVGNVLEEYVRGYYIAFISGGCASTIAQWIVEGQTISRE